MNTNLFLSIDDLLEYKMNLKLSSENIFTQYLDVIYSNLILREETISSSISKRKSQEINLNENNLPSLRSNSFHKKSLQNNKIFDKGISLEPFLEYMDIQAFIGERIYKYLNKSQTMKLKKSDFSNGLNKIYYSDIQHLIKFTFFLVDFNDDGKVYKSDMKLLLAYIPCSTEFSQKLKIKQINKIINTFFNEKIGNPKEGNEKEINFDLYSKYIYDYADKNNNINNSKLLNDFNNNAPFFYFISILSYLFQNIPFNVKNVDYFIYSQKKTKLTLTRNSYRSSSVKSNSNTTAKKKDIMNDRYNQKLNFSLKGFSANRADNNKFRIESIPKIGQKELFKTKVSVSQSSTNINNINAYNDKYIDLINNKKKDFIICKNKKEINTFNKKKEINSLKMNFRKSPKILPKFQKNFLNLTKKDSSPLTHSPLLNNFSQSPQLHLKLNNNSNEENSNNNKNSSNNIFEMKFSNSKTKLPKIANEKLSPMSDGYLRKEEYKDIEEPGDFVLCEYSGNEEDFSNNKNEENYDDSNYNEVYLYKNDEDFNRNKKILTQYYGVLSGKEILFFSSEQKNELCDLWYIYKGHISTGKEEINHTNYFTINIVFFSNNFVNKLYFLNENICQNFSNKIRKSIHDSDFNDYYELKEKLGKGHFAYVNKCKNKISGQIYAVKIINKRELKSIDLELIQQEKNFLKLIKHPNILSLKDYFEDKKNIYLVTECCEGGDLIEFIEKHHKENKPISEKTTCKIIKIVAEGIKYLNFFGIVHRDIKPENILFSEEKEIKSLKIIDLGVCQTLTYGELTSEPIGTNGYIPPEIYQHKNYSFEVDIWSLGVILYLLITEGILPFDHEEMDYKIIGKKVLFLHQEYPEKYFGNKNKALICLLDKMLEKVQSKRININNLLKDSWFNIIKI